MTEGMQEVRRVRKEIVKYICQNFDRTAQRNQAHQSILNKTLNLFLLHPFPHSASSHRLSGLSFFFPSLVLTYFSGSVNFFFS